MPRLIWIITTVALLAAFVNLLIVRSALTRVRTDRAQGVVAQSRLEQSVTELRNALHPRYRQLEECVDGVPALDCTEPHHFEAAQPLIQTCLERSHEIVGAGSSDEPIRGRLLASFMRLRALERRIADWATRTTAAQAADERAAAAVAHAELAAWAVAQKLFAEEQLRLAREIRRYRFAAPAERAALAAEIVDAVDAPRQLTVITSELTGLRALTGRLLGEDLVHEVDSLRGNEALPTFRRLDQAMSLLADDQREILAPAIARLRSALLGAAADADPAGAAAPASAGLFDSRRAALALREEGRDLRAVTFASISTLLNAERAFDQLTHQMSATAAARVEQTLRRVWANTIVSVMMLGVTLFLLAVRVAGLARKAEETLREKEQLLTSIISKSPMHVFWKDRDSVFLGCNNLFAQVAGLSDPAEIVGKTDYDLPWTRAEAEAYRSADQEVIRNGVALLDIEESCRQADGTEATLLTSKVPLRDKEGAVIGVLGIFADISSRKILEEQLRLQSSALASAGSAIMITDLTGRIRWVNPAFTTLTGYAFEEILDEVPTFLRSGVHDGEFYRQLWATITAGDVWRGELVNKRRDGTLYDEEMTITPVRDEAKRITHFVAIKQDITERRRAERLALERDKLREAVKAHERVLGVVGHELRTPLAGLLMITEFLQRAEDRASADFETFLNSAHDEIKRMSGTVNDLLEVARINSGIARWNWGEVNVLKACSEAAATIAPLLDPQRVVLRVEVDPPDLQMAGDEAAIRRLVLNLLSNASKHTTDGAIAVTAQPCPDGEPAIELCVADTGAGMNAETAARLGQAFALNSGVVGETYVAGSGLGLAICRGIVSAHGGTFTVKSQLNVGTTCCVRLRCDLTAPAASDGLVEIATEAQP